MVGRVRNQVSAAESFNRPRSGADATRTGRRSDPGRPESNGARSRAASQHRPGTETAGGMVNPTPEEEIWLRRARAKNHAPGLQEFWEERAAIMEFDGGLTRDDAERMAVGIVFDLLSGRVPKRKYRSPVSG